MRLNPDCIRDVLLTIEEHTDMSRQMVYPDNTTYEHLEAYSQDEVLYHIKQCELSGFVTKVSWYGGGGLGCRVFFLSPIGHEFLANIRSDTVWHKTKDAAKKVGSFSLDTLSKIAVSVISNLIKENM